MTGPRGRGRPAFKPTDKQRQTVLVMAGNGDSQTAMARAIGISEHTLRRAFRDEITHGRDSLKAMIGNAVVRAARAGNVAAQKFWLVTHGGPEWRVVEGRQIGVPPGAEPIPISAEGRVVIYLPDNGRDR